MSLKRHQNQWTEPQGSGAAVPLARLFMRAKDGVYGFDPTTPSAALVASGGVFGIDPASTAQTIRIVRHGGKQSTVGLY